MCKGTVLSGILPQRGSRVDRALVAGGYLKIVQTDGHRFVRITDKGREALAAAEIQ